nr:phosphotriesterase-related protein [Mesorhizobium sp.]
MTVLGPIDASELGKTISHEHLFIDLSCYLQPPAAGEDPGTYYDPVTIEALYHLRRDPYGNRDNCILDDVDLAVREVELFKKAGGGTIVDVTLVDIGRNVTALAEVSRRTGVHVLAGLGHYIHSSHPAYVEGMSEQQLAASFLKEINDGIDGTGIKPGIIGEIGTYDPIHPREKKVLRAAARAQMESGLPITVHVHSPARRGNEVLDILIGEGVAPEKIVLDHIDVSLAHLDIEFAEAVDYVASLLDRGANVEFDLCGNSSYFMTSDHQWWMPSDRERAKALALLCKRGFGGQLMLSQDVGHKHYLQSFGGWGYSHVLTDFSHYMRQAGLDQVTIDRFFIDNPARILARAGS